MLAITRLEDRCTPSIALLVTAPFVPNAERIAVDTYRVELGRLSLTHTYADLQAMYGADRVELDLPLPVQQTPNDPDYGLQWAYPRINAPAAWDTRTTAHAVTVAVIDTGVDWTHPDLAANIWTNPGETPGDGIDNDGNGRVDDIRGWDFRNGDNDPMDDHSHGTHVAGTIGAVGNNGIGVTGVAWGVKILPLKYASASGSGSTSAAIACIDYAIAAGAKVINNSWGSSGLSTSLQLAMGRAQAAGVVVVNASGNNGWNLDAAGTDFYPAEFASSFPNLIAVGSTNGNDDRSGFSNYGSAVTIHAPGEGIYSTWVGGGYGYKSGTSMAAPHVAGAAALYFAQHPNKTAVEVVDALKLSADTVPAGRRLNLSALLGTNPPAVTGVTIENGNAQRSKVKTFTVDFGSAVQVADGAFQLERAGGGTASATFTTTLTDGHTRATVTVSGNTLDFDSLADGGWTLRIDRTKVTNGGVAMTADHMTTFHRLFGDGDGDADVDNKDLWSFRRTHNRSVGDSKYDPAFDFNADGTVDAYDYGLFRVRFGTSI